MQLKTFMDDLVECLTSPPLGFGRLFGREFAIHKRDHAVIHEGSCDITVGLALCKLEAGVLREQV